MFLSALVGTAAPVEQIALDERAPVDVVVRSPYATPESRAGGLAIITAFDRALREHTSLFAREVKDSPDLVAARGDAREVAKVVARDPRPPRYLLLVTCVEAGEQTRLTALFVDVGRAVEARDDATFQDVAVIARPATFTAPHSDGAVTWAARLVEDELKGVLEREGVWDALGSIDVETEIEGAEIRLDGQLVGTSRSGINRLTGARLGARSVSLAAAGYAPWEARVEVTAGATVHTLAELVAQGAETGRTSVLWASVGLAAAGAVLLTYSAVEASGDSRYLCLEAKPGDGCPGRPFLTFGSSLAVAPLGLGLAIGGATGVVGPEFLETEGFPWISVVSGVTLGVLTYVISASLASELHPTPLSE